METEGYEMRFEGSEIEAMPDANNINIEHRLFRHFQTRLAAMGLPDL